MTTRLTPAQQRLADYMSELSESAFSAGWMEGLEVALWQALPDKPFTYGRLALTSDHLNRLTELSTACGGWIHFDDEHEESFVSFDDWRRHLDPLQGRGE
ncbi:hypothetical protein OU995_19990 [Roseateles sp. SL47]|jgi:hypothetical protein|uniref:hypothetical protein n=1 Tax=Roseateles sp. SL47 TaxID=2995138 RepID=UPI00226D5EFF|nr:hypothetical protein [Roseateles sp. SL47]WAC71847.1 hypothetical protein OU995_19990 [Roseateles sp. SL47]